MKQNVKPAFSPRQRSQPINVGKYIIGATVIAYYPINFRKLFFYDFQYMFRNFLLNRFNPFLKRSCRKRTEFVSFILFTIQQLTNQKVQFILAEPDSCIGTFNIHQPLIYNNIINVKFMGRLKPFRLHHQCLMWIPIYE